LIEIRARILQSAKLKPFAPGFQVHADINNRLLRPGQFVYNHQDIRSMTPFDFVNSLVDVALFNGYSVYPAPIIPSNSLDLWGGMLYHATVTYPRDSVKVQDILPYSLSQSTQSCTGNDHL
jgi:hypothetical protein